MFFYLLIFAHAVTCDEFDKGNYVIREMGVGDEQAMNIVTQINNFRTMVAQGKLHDQPKASNLKRLKYNLFVAYQTQRITDTCNFSKADYNASNTTLLIVPNLLIALYYYEEYEHTYSRSDWNSVLKLWFEQHYTYHYPYETSSNRYYQQLVSAHLTEFGCGYTMCNHKTKWKSYKLYMCRFIATKAYNGKYPYSVGEGCENLC